MDTLYTFWDNITHYKNKSVHFLGLMHSATKDMGRMVSNHPELCILFLGVLLVGSQDFNCLGFDMNYNKEAKSLTFWRGSEVSQDLLRTFFIGV